MLVETNENDGRQTAFTNDDIGPDDPVRGSDVPADFERDPSALGERSKD